MSSLATYAQTEFWTAAITPPSHPRLLLLAGEEKNIRQHIANDKDGEKMHQAILTEADMLLSRPPLERVLDGKRLLRQSRECIHRVFFLAYAWRLTKKEQYFRRAEKEMLAEAAFSDWNPAHFLDVAEMTTGMAIGYDWLYNDLSETSRTLIRQAILKKGLEPSLDPKYNDWLKRTNNWNQVCNAGISYGALATYEDHPELTRQLVNRAIISIKLPMEDYAPDGAYPEGFGYWNYGTTYNVLLVSELKKILGSDFGLSAQPGFLKTAGYLEHMTGPSGQGFNYSDSGATSDMVPAPAMFWFAEALHDPAVLWSERAALQRETAKECGKNRFLPAALVWGSNLNLKDITPPAATMWVGEGKNPVALMRTSWTDPAAIFVGLKSGSPAVSHGHMDVGSFVMEADGVRWAMDFGQENYGVLEAHGVDLFKAGQQSPRWDIFRYNNSAHNTLTVENGLQREAGKASITAVSDSPQFMSATTDLTEIYRDVLAHARRGVAILDRSYVVVRDEIETRPTATTVRWTMVTPAVVRITGANTAELTKDGKKLLLQVQEPAQVTMHTWPTTSPHDYESPNPGTTMVGFEVTLPAGNKSNLTVLLVPEKAIAKTKSSVAPLAAWPGKHSTD